MAGSNRAPPSFFLIPDEKINYDDTVQLGNILYRVSEPDNVLASQSPSTTPSTKTLQDYHVSSDASRSRKVGLFTKILDLLGFGINASSKRAKSDQKSYTVSSMTITTFVPSKEYMALVEKDTKVADWLRNSTEKSAFLITGVVMATGVKFTSSTTREAEHEGSVGIASSGLSLGPNASKSRKNVLEVSYKDAGPAVLAYRVQKLAMLESGSMTAAAYTEGAYFGEEQEDAMAVGSDVEFIEEDVEEFERVDGVAEFEGVDYALWVVS